MLRKDFKPNRLNIALQATKNFIESKFAIDPKDRIAIITFGDSSKKLSAFSIDQDKLIESMKNLEISGVGIIEDALAFSLQLLVEEMRKIGGKVQRIVIISDDKLKTDMTRVMKLVKVAKGLGIFIDACQLGKTQEYKESALKKIAQGSGGEYGFFTNSKAVIQAGKAFASKKTIKEPDYFSPNKKVEAPPLISEIAMQLRRPTVMEIRSMMAGGRGQEKCQICHSVKAPATSADFYSEGRYCPSCDRAMHLSCAAQWAKKSEYKENIFRCPFCYFLLEVPQVMMKLIGEKLGEKTDGSQRIKILDEDDKVTKMIEIAPNEVSKIDASCVYCNSIFLEDFKVLRCEKCGSYYHEPCLQKVFNELKSCRFCGARIQNFE